MPAEGRDDRTRLAVEALAVAKADARARGDRPASQLPPGAGGTDGPSPARGRPRREDPQRLELAIGGLLDNQGWQQRAAIGSVFGRWAEIVGADLAAHTKPDAFPDGELAVTADSTAWATQVRLLAPQLVRRLNAELDAGRRDRLAGLVADAEQVLVTAAVPADVPSVLAGARFEVRAGEIGRAG